MLGAITIVATLLLLAGAAFAAKSPFGIATPDSSGEAFTGPLGGLFAWVAVYQAQFYKALTHAFADMKQDSSAAYTLAGISFLYGVFHAVGPGHGKAVITSYLLVSRQTVQRGILISFAAALMQGLVAIAIVLVAAVMLRATAIGMTRVTNWFEIISYALIVAVGLWLLWIKITGREHHHHHAHEDARDHEHQHTHAHAHEGNPHGVQSIVAHAHAQCCHGTGPDHDYHEHSHEHDHGDAGHSHAPDPRLLSQPLTFGRAWAAILAVGIRPCSGAIIILVFALSQHWLFAGIGSVLAMSLGTFITVSALAVLAIGAKDVALRLARLESRTVDRVVRMLEIGGAALVLLAGLTLLGGALAS
jgi:nickel/cobalt transporter (NicO) family protein